MQVSGQLHAPAALPREPAPGTHCIGCWVGPIRSEHYGEEKNLLLLPGIEPRFLGCRARNLDDMSIEISKLQN
jgi:hypothetical protein